MNLNTDIKNLVRQAEILKAELSILRQSLDNAAIQEALRIEFTFESNRIEGNPLTLRETEMVINKGLTIGGKSLKEHLEAINHKEAILLIEEIVSKQIDFSESVLKQLHGIILHGIDRDNAGVYRRVPVMISGSKYVPPQPYLLQGLIDDYFLFYKSQKNVLHPIILAAEMHEKLVTIHPFIDGNGRASRLTMNLILLQNGYPLTIIGGDYESRKKYYDALEKVQANNDKIAFVQFIAENVANSLNHYLKILKGS